MAFHSLSGYKFLLASWTTRVIGLTCTVVSLYDSYLIELRRPIHHLGSEFKLLLTSSLRILRTWRWGSVASHNFLHGQLDWLPGWTVVVFLLNLESKLVPKNLTGVGRRVWINFLIVILQVILKNLGVNLPDFYHFDAQAVVLGIDDVRIHSSLLTLNKISRSNVIQGFKLVPINGVIMVERVIA